MDEIRIEVATAFHRDGMLNVARRGFVEREPARVQMGVTWEAVQSEWEELIDACLQHPHSHVAVTRDNTVVGIRLSRILNLEQFKLGESINDFLSPGHLRNVEDIATKDWAKVFVNEKGETCKKLLQFLALSVLPEYCGRGIAHKMCVENLSLGKALGCEHSSVVASNWISQRIFEKLGFTTKETVLFAEYRDENGEKPFQALDPKQATSKWQVKKL